MMKNHIPFLPFLLACSLAAAPGALADQIDDLVKRAEAGPLADRVLAMREISAFEEPRTTDLFLRLLRDGEETIRYNAALVMERSKNMLAVKPLARASLHDPSFLVRLRASETLYRLGISTALNNMHSSLLLSDQQKVLLALKSIAKIKDTKSVGAVERRLLKVGKDDASLVFCFQRTLDILKNRLETSRLEKSEQSMVEAVSAFERQDYNKVKLLVDEALLSDPHCPEAHYWRAEVAMYVDKDSATALKSYQYAQKYCYPQQGELFFKMGTAALLLKQFDQAVTFLQQAHRLDKDPKALYQLGVAYSNMGKVADATSMFERTVQADPGLREAHCALSEIYGQTGQAAKAAQHQTLCGP